MFTIKLENGEELTGDITDCSFERCKQAANVELTPLEGKMLLLKDAAGNYLFNDTESMKTISGLWVLKNTTLFDDAELVKALFGDYNQTTEDKEIKK